MVNLIQPITVQQAYDGITHARRWASWNWWWRMVDDGDGFPSPEPRTDSRSALPREFRAWRRLRIVKRDESFSLVFYPISRHFYCGRLRAPSLPLSDHWSADTSPTYLLFQTLWPLFWTLICMIWMKLTPDWRCFHQNYHGVVFAQK